ncbi:hypothetical protein O3P69_002626 [Scylla paramamosain]|uniref:Uncharacterized protein n=1 Tax=Scylla paramamosain TaxID=85552 RepID=A0AAW0ULF8_SCYPA
MNMKKTGSNFGGREEEPDEILYQVVEDASCYTVMKMPGSLQPSHLFPPFSGELVLLTVPDAMNPLDLINSEVVVGGRKDSLVVAAGQRFRMATFPIESDNINLPSLFLPDQNGQLSKVTAEIKACLMVKGEVEEREEDGKNCVDIEALRSVHYKAPKDLQRRDFFTKTKTREVVMEIEKPVKRKKKNVGNIYTSLDTSLQSNGKVQSPGKKKKTKHFPQSSNKAPGNSPHAEGMEYPV